MVRTKEKITASSSGGSESIFINGAPTNALSKSERTEVKESIFSLVERFKLLSPKSFEKECQRAIEQHGFTVFRDIFDTILVEKGTKTLFGENKIEEYVDAFNAINNYIVDRFINTITPIVLDGAKI